MSEAPHRPRRKPLCKERPSGVPFFHIEVVERLAVEGPLPGSKQGVILVAGAMPGVHRIWAHGYPFRTVRWHFHLSAGFAG